MLPKLPSLPATIKRLLDRMSDEERRDAPGFVFIAPSASIDDGAYGDPLTDTRPDFIREDERGWE